MSKSWFPSVAAFLLLLLAIYGMIGAIFNYRELSSITHNNGKWPFNQKPIYKIFICIQSCYLLTGVLGIISAAKRTSFYFLWSFFFLLGIFSVLIICGAVCLRVSSVDMQSDIYSAFRKNLVDENDIDWLTDIQYQHQCCGIYSYMDWGLFKISLPFGNTSVPDSCCRRGEYYVAKDCGAGYLVPNRTVAEAGQFIYTNGCSTVISHILWNNSKWIGGEMVTAGLCTLAVAIFIYSGVIKDYCLKEEANRAINENSGNRTNNGNNAPGRTYSRRRGYSNISTRTNSGNTNRLSNTENNNIRESSCRLASGTKKSRGMDKPNRNLPTIAETDNCNKTGKCSKKRLQKKSKFNYGSQNFSFSQPKNDPASNSLFANCYQTEDALANKEIMFRQNLEMLMNPIEGNFSTLSTTPNPSESLNFLTLQQSTSPPPIKGKNMDNLLKEPCLSHYSSLPMVTANMNYFSDGERGNYLLSDTHFYNGSHYHRQRPQEFPKIPPEVATAVNFVPGKFASPSMTHSTTLATIQEETESLKSGAASTSPKAASPNTTPQSLSQKSSSNCSEDNNSLLLYKEQRVIIDIVDANNKVDVESDYDSDFVKSESHLGKTESKPYSLKLKSTKEFSVSKSSFEDDHNENKSECNLPGVTIENISLDTSESLRIPKTLNSCIGITRKDSAYIGANSETVPISREIMTGQENSIIAFE